MDLFKRDPIVPQEFPEVFITIVDPDGSVLPDPDWCKIVPFESIAKLVTVDTEHVLIHACPDLDKVIAQIRLVIEHGALFEVSVVHVKGVTPYVPSAMADSAMWQVREVLFEDWRLQADEAAREAELARRSESTRDEKRMIDNARTDGSFKKVDVTTTEVEDEVPEAPVF